MVSSQRVANAKNSRFHDNVHKRGQVPGTVTGKKEYSVGPIVIGFFLFVVRHLHAARNVTGFAYPPS